MRKMMRMRKIASAMAVMVLLGVSALVLVSGASGAEPYEMTTTIDDMDEGRAFAAVVALDDRIYVIGGGTTLNSYGDPAVTLDDVLIYDTSTGEQSRGASMIRGVGLSACVVGEDNLIYVIGGWNTSLLGYVNRVQVYDPVEDSWKLTDTLTPLSVGYCASTLGHDGRIYMFGGGFSMFTTLIYDPLLDAFEFGADFPYGMHGGAAITLADGTILVAGGVNRTSGAPTTDTRLYDPESDEWKLTGPMGTPRNQLSLATGRTGYVYAIAGSDSWNLYSAVTVYNSIESYDPATGEWTPSTTTLNYRRATHGSVTDSDGMVWIIAGYRTSLVPQIEMMLTSEMSGYDTLIFVSPTDGSTVSGVTAVQAVLVNSWWSSLMGVDLLIDGELYESQSYGNSWVFIWDATGLVDGSTHELTVVGFSWDGSTQEVSVTVTVSALSVDDKLDMLETVVADLTVAIDDLQDTVDSQGMDIADLAAALDALQAAVDSQTLDIAALQGALDAVQTELAALSGDLADLDSATADRILALESQLELMIGDLQEALEDSQSSVDDLQESVDGVQTSVDKKADGTLMYAVILLLVVVIVLMLVMMMMGRKSPPPPPAQ